MVAVGCYSRCAHLVSVHAYFFEIKFFHVVFIFLFFFFFKQKTAYEMLRSLVGSEMCIRDRLTHSLPLFVYTVMDTLGYG